MADTTTELEVLDQIVDVLGGTSGQYETVVPVLQQIKELLGGGGSGSGYNPSLSVGRADALTGADTTAQWAQRVTAGSGAATVRSVQGAAEVQDGELVPVRIAGIRSTGFNLLNLERSEIVTSAGQTPDTKRSFNENQIWVGLARNNNYNRARIDSYDVTDEYVSVSLGTNGTGYGIGFPIKVNPSTTYYFNSGDEEILGVGVGFYTVDGTYIDNNYQYRSGTFTTPVNCYWATFVLLPQVTGEVVKFTHPRFNYSDAARNGEYEPYRIVDAIEWTTQTLRAAGSVADMLYRDHVDVKVGAVDLGTLTWTKNANYGYYTAGVASLIKRPANVYTTPNIRVAGHTTSSWDTLNAGGTATDRVAVYPFGGEVAFSSDAATAADFKAAMDGVWLFYELAETTTQVISPTLPMTYRVEQGGSESIIVPSGEVSATPVLNVADGKSAADVVMDALACIAAPDGPVATANHSVGTYLTMQGKLYKVTSAIAVGETIKSGTNVTETTVMAELIARTA